MVDLCVYQWIYLWEQGNSVYRNPSPKVHIFMAFHVPRWVLHVINMYAIWLLKPRGIHLLFLIPQTCKSAFICSSFGWLLSLLTLLDHSQYCVRHIGFLEGSEPYSDLFKKKKTNKQNTQTCRNFGTDAILLFCVPRVPSCGFLSHESCTCVLHLFKEQLQNSCIQRQ